MQLSIDTADPRPIHAQIMDEVRRAVVLGTLATGDALPPVRHLAAELRVNPASVAEAYRALEGEGLVAMRWGRGPVVAERAAAPGDRDALVRQVAERALRDARRHGISAAELAEALRAAASPSPRTTEAAGSSAWPVDAIAAPPSPAPGRSRPASPGAIPASPSPEVASPAASTARAGEAVRAVASPSSSPVSPAHPGAPS